MPKPKRSDLEKDLDHRLSEIWRRHGGHLAPTSYLGAYLMSFARLVYLQGLVDGLRAGGVPPFDKGLEGGDESI